jgi:hypothetical protein
MAAEKTVRNRPEERLDRRRVARLVQHHFDVAGQDKGRGDSPALVQGLTLYIHSLATKLVDGRGDVVAHEGQLMADTALESGPSVG